MIPLSPPRSSSAPTSSRIRELLRLVDQPGMLSMAGGLPAPATLDVGRVRVAVDRALDRVGPLGPVALQYGPTEGVDELRRIIAAQSGVDVAQVLVTTGSQQAIDLVARSWCSPGDAVVVEGPSYLGALQSFTASRAEVVTVDGDDDGIDVAELERRLGGGWRPRLVYVVANFHNPTSAVLSVDRRRRLAQLADTHGFLVVEDDPYRELRFAGPDLASIASYGRNIARIGSASKILGPGLRVGWLVAPQEVVDAASRMKQAADLHTPSLNQLVVADLLGDREAQDRHLHAVRGLYRERAAALDAALREHLGDRVRARRPRGGMFTWAECADGTDADDLFDRAMERGVAFVSGSAFSADPARFRHAFRLSFATLEPDAIRTAVERLAAAWRRPAQDATRVVSRSPARRRIARRDASAPR